MSVKYIPVQWNRVKWLYDLALILAVGAYLYTYIALVPPALEHDRAINGQILRARAFGSAAFLMLTVILAIGPLARINPIFSPLLYNRRHFGVLTCLVALAHVEEIIDWYFAFSPTAKWEAVFSANTAYDRFLGFPFEALGFFALVSLLILAATSHDFWLKFLTPRVWKGLHWLIYPAWLAVVAHVSLGGLQHREDPVLAGTVLIAALLIPALHIWAALIERREVSPQSEGWHRVGPAQDIPDGRARIVLLPSGEKVAVFRDGGKIAAISNACAHQNGPLGEGRILDGCVTCPWHGFQYRLEDGRSPAPFTEQVPTYRTRIKDGIAWVHPTPNAPGTPERPTPLEPVVL